MQNRQQKRPLAAFLVALGVIAIIFTLAYTVSAQAISRSSSSRSSSSGSKSSSGSGSKCCSSSSKSSGGSKSNGSSKSSKNYSNGVKRPSKPTSTAPSSGPKYAKPVTKTVPSVAPSKFTTVKSGAPGSFGATYGIPRGRDYNRDRAYLLANPRYADPYGGRSYYGYYSDSNPYFYMWLFAMMDDDRSNNPLPPEDESQISNALISYMQIIGQEQKITASKAAQ